MYSKKYTKHFPFPWENPQGKNFFPFFSFLFFFSIALVKFRDLKKGIPKMLQETPRLSFLMFFLQTKRNIWVHSPLFVVGSQSTAKGDLILLGSLLRSPGGSWWKMVINLHQPQFISCNVSQTCFWQRNKLCSSPYSVSLSLSSTANQWFDFFQKNIIDIWSFFLLLTSLLPPVCLHSFVHTK